MSSQLTRNKYNLLRVRALAASGEMVIFHFQVKTFYNEPELEGLLETMERRGAGYRHLGDGRYRLHIPTDIPWIPFYKTIRNCNSVELTDVTTVSQRRTILIEPEG